MNQRLVMTLLSAATVGSFLAATGTVVVLNPEDRITVVRGSVLTGLGFVFFASLFELVAAAGLHTGAGARFRKNFHLRAGDVLDISNKVVSAVQAFLSCVSGAVVCAWSCTRDFLTTSHFISDAYAWFGAAYFFYDIWSMYKVHIQMTLDKVSSSKPVRQAHNGDGAAAGEGGQRAEDITFWQYCRHDPVILLHHLFIGGFGFLTIVYLRGNLGDCVFGFAYLMELSTPFVCARGVLSRLGLKASRLYLVNGLTMLVSFFVCRVVSMPYVCLMYSRVINKPYFEAISTLPRGCKISICILMVPQIYWFYLMSYGAVKVFLGKDSKSKKLSSMDSKSFITAQVDKRS